jgi:hypothetical protein
VRACRRAAAGSPRQRAAGAKRRPLPGHRDRPLRAARPCGSRCDTRARRAETTCTIEPCAGALRLDMRRRIGSRRIACPCGPARPCSRAGVLAALGAQKRREVRANASCPVTSDATDATPAGFAGERRLGRHDRHRPCRVPPAAQLGNESEPLSPLAQIASAYFSMNTSRSLSQMPCSTSRRIDGFAAWITSSLRPDARATCAS